MTEGLSPDVCPVAAGRDAADVRALAEYALLGDSSLDDLDLD